VKADWFMFFFITNVLMTLLGYREINYYLKILQHYNLYYNAKILKL
jgi:hypothetical protein